MLISVGIASDAADLRADGDGVAIAPGITGGTESGLPQQLIDRPGGRPRHSPSTFSLCP
jgi:hypothetical protein